VRLHQHFEALNEWDNELWIWRDGDAAIADLEPLAMTNHTQGPAAKAICDKWVAKLGWGFHPDTRGADYDPPLSKAEVAAYEADMKALFALVPDPYLYGVQAMEKLK
jgi:hypothetical protein